MGLFQGFLAKGLFRQTFSHRVAVHNREALEHFHICCRPYPSRDTERHNDVVQERPLGVVDPATFGGRLLTRATRISVAPSGAGFGIGFPNPRLAPWAMIFRPYGAEHR